METDFVNWLQEELKNRGMNQSDLSRRSGISTGSISDVISGRRKAGREFATAVARGFDLPVETVFQEAGFLPKEKPKHSREIEQIITIVENMPPDEQKELLSYIRWKNNQNKK
jgi:transcriptional regulator with XRE-family HTH domain